MEPLPWARPWARHWESAKMVPFLWSFPLQWLRWMISKWTDQCGIEHQVALSEGKMKKAGLFLEQVFTEDPVLEVTAEHLRGGFNNLRERATWPSCHVTIMGKSFGEGTARTKAGTYFCCWHLFFPPSLSPSLPFSLSLSLSETHTHTEPHPYSKGTESFNRFPADAEGECLLAYPPGPARSGCLPKFTSELLCLSAVLLHNWLLKSSCCL